MAQYVYFFGDGRADGNKDMKDLLQDTSMTVHQSNADYKAADQRGAASFDF